MRGRLRVEEFCFGTIKSSFFRNVEMSWSNSSNLQPKCPTQQDTALNMNWCSKCFGTIWYNICIFKNALQLFSFSFKKRKIKNIHIFHIHIVWPLLYLNVGNGLQTVWLDYLLNIIVWCDQLMVSLSHFGPVLLIALSSM